MKQTTKQFLYPIIFTGAFIMVATFIAYAAMPWIITMSGKTPPLPLEPDLEVYVASSNTLLNDYNWGECLGGYSKTLQVDVRNVGTGTATLFMTSIGAGDYDWLDITWDSDGEILGPGELHTATFTLTISETCPPDTPFNFTCEISG